MIQKQYSFGIEKVIVNYLNSLTMEKAERYIFNEKPKDKAYVRQNNVRQGYDSKIETQDTYKR